MIPYVDVAIGAFLKSQLPPEFGVVMSEPELTLQNLSKENKEERIGIPGVGYWRTHVDKGETFTMPQAANPGVKQGTIGSDVIFTRQIPRKLTYSITGFTKHLSDRNKLESAFAFMGIYNCITARVLDASQTEEDEGFEFEFDIFTHLPDYFYDKNPSTGMMNWFVFKTEIQTEAPWVRGASVPRIEKIFVDYYDQIATGELIENNIFEHVEIAIDGDEIVVTGEEP